MVNLNKIYPGDTLATMKTWPDAFVQTCVTSPPYFGLRDYGSEGQGGLEPSPEAYVAGMVAVFREVKRVLRDDGTLWLNLGDSYARDPAKGGSGTPNGRNGRGENYRGGGLGEGLKAKDLIGIPWMVAFALRADGWYLRADIIWHKPNPMPESVTDRPTAAHEHIFLLTKGPRYYYDAYAIKESANRKNLLESRSTRRPRAGHSPDAGFKNGRKYETRNKRNVWTVATKPFKGAHFATFPDTLIEPCILAGAGPRGVVLDPFMGAGTTGLVAARNGRQYIGCELNPAYITMAEKRISEGVGLGGLW